MTPEVIESVKSAIRAIFTEIFQEAKFRLENLFVEDNENCLRIIQKIRPYWSRPFHYKINKIFEMKFNLHLSPFIYASLYDQSIFDAVITRLIKFHQLSDYGYIVAGDGITSYPQYKLVVIDDLLNNLPTGRFMTENLILHSNDYFHLDEWWKFDINTCSSIDYFTNLLSGNCEFTDLILTCYASGQKGVIHTLAEEPEQKKQFALSVDCKIDFLENGVISTACEHFLYENRQQWLNPVLGKDGWLAKLYHRP